MSGNDFVERTVIKASAGTGKTHNLTGYYLGSLNCTAKNWNEEEKEKFPLNGKACDPEEIIAVTFTKKAASELKDRFRNALIKEGRHKEAARVEGALIGTVHSVCLRLLQEYALDAGFSPVAEELSEEDGKVLFRRAVAPLMEKYAFLNDLFDKFGLDAGIFGKSSKGSRQPMLDFCRELIALARINGLEGDFEELGWKSLKEVFNLLDTLCPELAGDGEAEFAAMRSKLKEMLISQRNENTYDWSGRLSKEDKAAGVQKKLSSKEAAHLEFIKRLPDVPHMHWKHWLSLIGREAGQNDNTLKIYVEELNALGLLVFGLPLFRADVERLILCTFSFAAEAMKRFSEAKQNAGVVDFADMERMARQALMEPEVQERLKGRFRVLFVDEFQDTSPIQLSIFHLLGQIIHGTEDAPGRIIYVGDDKQSIYGFRGAAAELTRNCTPEGLWKPKALKTCWRSLPEICDFTNSFFCQIANDALRTSLLGAPEKDADGEPKPLLNIKSVLDDDANVEHKEERKKLRKSLSGIESLQFWLTGIEEGGKGRLNKNDVFASLARNIAGLCGRLDEDGHIMSEKEAKRQAELTGRSRAAKVSRIGKLGNIPTEEGTRPVEPGDIAVLCRSNKDCVAMADALEELGIKAAAEREGLLEQDDVALCLNALRLVLDPKDKLAAAELHLALNGGDAWFEAAAQQKGEPGSLWEGIPFVKSLDALHKRLGQLTPSELLDETLSAADSFRLAAAKPRREERFADLEALRALVREYEQAMHSRRSSATAQGWLDWLKEKEPGRASGGQDAVQVWTYHKSKGLERKVVILHGLSDKTAKVDIFQPRAGGIPSPDKDPLEGRTLQWMPNVFRGAAKQASLEEFFKKEKKRLKSKQLEESLRLLYVGMTRACDVLILTANMKKNGGISSPWLEPFFSVEDNDQSSEPASGRSKKSSKNKNSAFDDSFKDIASAEDGTQAIFCGGCFQVTKNRGIKPAEWVSPKENVEAMRFPRAPEKADGTPREDAKAAGKGSLVSPKWRDFCGAGADVSSIPSKVERDQLGNMLHGWFAVWFGMTREQREAERASSRMAERIERFCALWNEAFTSPLWPDAGKFLIPLADALEKAVLDWFNNREDKHPGDELVIRTEWPLEHRLEEAANGIVASRLDSMRVDLMAEVLRADGTAGPCLIVDHKCGKYDRKSAEDLKQHLTEAYGQRQSDYMRALYAMGRKCQCWLHLPLEGRMLELKLNDGEI